MPAKYSAVVVTPFQTVVSRHDEIAFGDTLSVLLKQNLSANLWGGENETYITPYQSNNRTAYSSRNLLLYHRMCMDSFGDGRAQEDTDVLNFYRHFGP